MHDDQTEIIDLLPPVEYETAPPRPGDPVLRGAVRVMLWTIALGFAAIVIEAVLWLRP